MKFWGLRSKALRRRLPDVDFRAYGLASRIWDAGG